MWMSVITIFLALLTGGALITSLSTLIYAFILSRRIRQLKRDAECDSSRASHHSSRLSSPSFDIVKILSNHAFVAKYGEQLVVVKRFHCYTTFARELSFLKDLSNHRNICSLVDSSVMLPYKIFMHYYEHGDLLEYLENISNFPYDSMCKIIKSIVVGVDYIHCRNIAHRDIKLQNIFTDGDTCVIGDFGLSVRRTSIDDVDKVPKKHSGTKRYLPNEIYSMDYTSFSSHIKCDIYALGLVIWEICNKFETNDYKFPDIPLVVDFTSNPQLELFATVIKSATNPNSDNRPQAQELLKMFEINLPELN